MSDRYKGNDPVLTWLAFICLAVSVPMVFLGIWSDVRWFVSAMFCILLFSILNVARKP